MIRRLSRLFRMKLSAMNGLAVLCGYCLFPGVRRVDHMLAAGVGVTLLAMGAAALNQVLERDIDALMHRTRMRPLPAGEMTSLVAAFIGGGAIVGGGVLLYMIGGALPTLLGMAALGWYLAVYTPLKRRTPLALLPGALCGAVPPLIGWCLAGGRVGDFRIVTLAGLFFIWQIPHFWLLQKLHAEDYRRAGIPLFSIRPELIILWIVALSATALMLPAFGGVVQNAAGWYGLSVIILLVLSLRRSGVPSMSCLNLFPILVALALLIR